MMKNTMAHNLYRQNGSLSTKIIIMNAVSWVSISYLDYIVQTTLSFTFSWRNQKSKSSTRLIISNYQVKIYIWRCLSTEARRDVKSFALKVLCVAFDRNALQSRTIINLTLSAFPSGPIELQFSSSRQILSSKHCKGFTLRLENIGVTLMFFILYPIFT